MREILTYFGEMFDYLLEYWTWASKVMAMRQKRIRLKRAIREADIMHRLDGKKRWVIDDPGGNPIVLNRSQIINLKKRNIIPKISWMELSTKSHYETK